MDTRITLVCVETTSSIEKEVGRFSITLNSALNIKLLKDIILNSERDITVFKIECHSLAFEDFKEYFTEVFDSNQKIEKLDKSKSPEGFRLCEHPKDFPDRKKDFFLKFTQIDTREAFTRLSLFTLACNFLCEQTSLLEASIVLNNLIMMISNETLAELANVEPIPSKEFLIEMNKKAKDEDSAMNMLNRTDSRCIQLMSN